MLQLSSAGVRCVTLAYGDDLVRSLSAWQNRPARPGGRRTMKIFPRFLYLVCFLGMALAAALALDRALQPSMSTILIRAVIMGGVLGAAGLVHRKAWGVSLVLLPLGAYVLFRTVVPPGAAVHGIGGLYHFYVEQFATGAEQYAAKFFPLDLAGAPELRLLLATDRLLRSRAWPPSWPSACGGPSPA